MKNTNLDIALTHLITRKKQTMVAALGVLIGVGIYLFMNSLGNGFSSFTRSEIFKVSPQISIFKDDDISSPLLNSDNPKTKYIITNPQIISHSNTLLNPLKLLDNIKKEPYITNAIIQVDFNAFYNKGSSQIKGFGCGVDMIAFSDMFNTQKYMVAGELSNLPKSLNGIIIGSGIANKLSLSLGENLVVSSSYGITKTLKIVGIFTTGNKNTDDNKCYVNIATAQQFSKQNETYVSTIYANTNNPDKSIFYAKKLEELMPYKVEDWTITYSDILAGDRARFIMMRAISFSILFVASFGIYNILSSTIMQKINDIAILKAIGFTGNDVVKIFVMEGLLMGFIGICGGILFGSILIYIMQHVYVGEPVGYFPVYFELATFVQSIILGFIVTLCAGYFPAKKAADVDPVSIFRK
ncbi:MAG: ABC transporter permease [Alphaproteobacteria bacterium]|nr:ABC transporter permease [Alphaproteobacteria bacterium]